MEGNSQGPRGTVTALRPAGCALPAATCRLRPAGCERAPPRVRGARGRAARGPRLSAVRGEAGARACRGVQASRGRNDHGPWSAAAGLCRRSSAPEDRATSSVP